MTAFLEMNPVASIAALALASVLLTLGVALISWWDLRWRHARLARQHRLLREAALAKGFEIEEVPARYIAAHIKLKARG
jgi:hypothetical protein